MMEVEYYSLPDGSTPLFEWVETLGDDATVGRITNRIDRLRLGNAGDHRSLGGGLWELRLDFGPGYRVYYSQVGSRLILLVSGGDKSSQRRDIRTASRYLADYLGRSNE